ncbi:MAG: hypothetical protein WC244_00840 [Patescibacteria group bacterium]|jgi:hypothetical protein
MEGDRPSKRNDFATNNLRNQNTYGKSNISDDKINNLNSIRKRERVNSVVILVVCVFALFFGYYQLASNINNPFSFLVKGNSALSTETDPQQEAINALKAQDTDSDGLSDYDESYVYNTSPYLTDSDGDGINDGQEVKQGTDPNCPEGKTCFGNGSSVSTSSAGTVPTFQASPPTQSTPQINISDIRKILVQSGLTQAEVDAMTDQDILNGYQEVLSENPDLASQITSNGVSVPTAVSTSTGSKTLDTSGLNISSIDDLKNLTGAQIKELMIKNGAPKTLLDSISDDELKQMFIDKLNSTATSTVK